MALQEKFQADHTDGAAGTAFVPDPVTKKVGKRRGDQDHRDEPGPLGVGATSGLEKDKGVKSGGGTDAPGETKAFPFKDSGSQLTREEKEELIAAIAEDLSELDEEELEELYNSFLEEDDNPFEKKDDDDDDDENEGDDDDDDKKKGEVDIKIKKESYVRKVTAEDLADLNLPETFGAIFENDDLSEDFKTKATDIFTTAVLAKVNEEVDRVASLMEEDCQEALVDIKEELTDILDAYLKEVVDEWETENELALESGIKNEVMEDFIAGLKQLFVEHYIEVPEAERDLVDELSDVTEALEEKLNETIEEKIALKEELDIYRKDQVLQTVCDDLTESEKEKLRGLAENIDFDDQETFTDKLKVIKENYFPVTGQRYLTEGDDDDALIVEDEKDVPPYMDSIIKAIAKQTRPFSQAKK